MFRRFHVHMCVPNLVLQSVISLNINPLVLTCIIKLNIKRLDIQNLLQLCYFFYWKYFHTHYMTTKVFVVQWASTWICFCHQLQWWIIISGLHWCSDWWSDFVEPPFNQYAQQNMRGRERCYPQGGARGSWEVKTAGYNGREGKSLNTQGHSKEE